jgi:GxxExxY protein
MLVKYDSIVVGAYATDLLVEDTVVVELRAVRALDNTHFAHCRIILRGPAYACAIC